jgi:hypothetical protein
MELNRKIAMVLDLHLRGVDGYGVTRLAAELGKGTRSVNNWCEGICLPNLADALATIRAVSLASPDRGLRMADELLGLIGLWVYQAPGATRPDVDPLPVDGCQLAESAGRLAGVIARAEADGVRTATEVAEIATATRDVERHVIEIRAEVHHRPTAERPLALAGAR